MSTLPPKANLTDEQCLLEVLDYELELDAFTCILISKDESWRMSVPAMLIPILTHQYGEPEEFVGTTLLVEKGAPMTHYRQVRDACIMVAENLKGDDDDMCSFRLDVHYKNKVDDALNATAGV